MLRTCLRNLTVVTLYSLTALTLLAPAAHAQSQDYPAGTVAATRYAVPPGAENLARGQCNSSMATQCIARAQSTTCPNNNAEYFAHYLTNYGESWTFAGFVVIEGVPIPIWDLHCTANCIAQCVPDLPYNPGDCQFTNQLVCEATCDGATPICVHLGSSCYACSAGGAGLPCPYHGEGEGTRR